MSEKIENLLASKKRYVCARKDLEKFVSELNLVEETKVNLATPIRSTRCNDYAQMEMFLNEPLKQKFIEFIETQVLSGLVQEEVAVDATIAEIEKLIG